MFMQNRQLLEKLNSHEYLVILIDIQRKGLGMSVYVAVHIKSDCSSSYFVTNFEI